MKAPKEPIASGGAVLAGSVESPVWATGAGHLLHAADAAAVATFRLSAGSASRVRRVPAVPRGETFTLRCSTEVKKRPEKPEKSCLAGLRLWITQG